MKKNRKTKLLNVNGIYSGYGKIQILFGVSIDVEEGGIVTIIGPNGSGKSTLLKTIMGYLNLYQGKIVFKGEDVTKLSAHKKVALGIGYVPQTQNVFPSLSILENLQMGAFIVEDSKTVQKRTHEIYEIFPILGERKNQKARVLSGGETQMLAIGTALMIKPALLILDEPSASVAPKMRSEIFEMISEINREGVSILMVEQEAQQSLSISHRGFVLAEGKNQFSDSADKILNSEDLRKSYLGM